MRLYRTVVYAARASTNQDILVSDDFIPPAKGAAIHGAVHWEWFQETTRHGWRAHVTWLLPGFSGHPPEDET